MQVHGRVGEGGGTGFREPTEEDIVERGGQRRGSTWGDRMKLDTFKGSAGRTASRTPQEASATPKEERTGSLSYSFR